MKILLNVVLGGGAHPSVHGDIRLHPTMQIECHHPVDLGEPHTVVQIELEIPVVHHIVLLGHEVGDQFEIPRGTGAGIVTGDCHMGFGEELHLDVEAFGGEGIIVVGFMEFGRVLQ